MDWEFQREQLHTQQWIRMNVHLMAIIQMEMIIGQYREDMV
jgi:hypothetical protein